VQIHQVLVLLNDLFVLYNSWVVFADLISHFLQLLLQLLNPGNIVLVKSYLFVRVKLVELVIIELLVRLSVFCLLKGQMLEFSQFKLLVMFRILGSIVLSHYFWL